MSEYLTAQDVALEWHVSEEYVYHLANREIDPLPLKKLPGKNRGKLVHRDDLREWFDRNAR